MKKHIILRCILTMMLLFLSQTIAFAAGEKDTKKRSKNNSFIVYIQGVDTRGDQTVADEGNADVNILACINPDAHKVLLLNTPRDYYYPLWGKPEYQDKLTHCGYYGIDCGIETLNSLYDIDIDYYVRVGFNSVRNIVDVLGGITVNSEWDFSAGGYHFNEGENFLNGDEALAFSRERYTLPGGDRARGKNQQKVIYGIINKITSAEMLPHALELMDAITSNITTDFPFLKATKLVIDQIAKRPEWEVESIQADGPSGWDYCYSLGESNDVMYVDQDSVDAAKEKVKTFMEE